VSSDDNARSTLSIWPRILSTLLSSFTFSRFSCRPYDKFGVAFVSNAIKADHQAYLKLGGLGFCWAMAN
jgi:hypothetical protein